MIPSLPPVSGLGLVRFRAFSLIEVVAAVGIFAVGMVAALALLASVAKSAATVSDAEAASRVAEAVHVRLQALPFDRAVALVQDPAAVQRHDAAPDYNPNDGTHPAVIFAKLDGEVGLYVATNTPKGWYDSAGARIADADKFFEVELIRNPTLSPAGSDETAALVAFSMRVRWPSFQPGSGGGAVQTGANQSGAVTFDHSRQQVLFFAGSITR